MAYRCYRDTTNLKEFDLHLVSVEDISRVAGLEIVHFTPKNNHSCRAITTGDLDEKEIKKLIEESKRGARDHEMEEGSPTPITVEQFESALLDLKTTAVKRYLTVLFKWFVGKTDLSPLPECHVILYQPGKAFITQDCADALAQQKTFE